MESQTGSAVEMGASSSKNNFEQLQPKEGPLVATANPIVRQAVASSSPPPETFATQDPLSVIHRSSRKTIGDAAASVDEQSAEQKSNRTL